MLTLEVDLSLEVGVVEDLHRDLLSEVLFPESVVLDVEVVAERESGEVNLFVPPGSKVRLEGPVRDQSGEGGEDEENPVELGPEVEEGERPLQKFGNKDDEEEEVKVAERRRSLRVESRKRSHTRSELMRMGHSHD